MTQPGTDADRHYSVLLGGGNNNIKIKIACGSGADVAVSQVQGVFVQELEDETINISGGPLIVDCAKHGKHLGLLELLLTQALEPGSRDGHVSMPLLLIPLRDIEYLSPLGLAQMLAQDQGTNADG